MWIWWEEEEWMLRAPRAQRAGEVDRGKVGFEALWCFVWWVRRLIRCLL